MMDPIPCAACRGTGRRSSPDATLGYDWPCHTCAGTGRANDGPATAHELAVLQAAAQAAGLEAAMLRKISLAQFGEVPNRLLRQHFEVLLAAVGDMTDEARVIAEARR